MNFDSSVLTDQEKLIFALRSLFRSAGYSLYRMSKFEEYDLYANNKDFLVSDSIITFTDINGKLKALKPDVTLSIIKNNKDDPASLLKLCYNEKVYRVSKGANGFKEINQTGLECIGNVDGECIREVLSLAIKSLALASRSFVLEISDLGILSDMTDELTADAFVKKEIIKLAGEKNLHGINELSGKYDLDTNKTAELLKLLSLYGHPSEVLKSAEKINHVAAKHVKELKNVLSGIDDTSVQIDFSLVSDMNYYNGIIFNGFIDGVPGSVLSGGQYDKLMTKMGRSSKAVGFAVYLDMLDRIEL
ncbi:MAG: ATP phosphoribosyltransferase regulatory subunit [Clostridia bacterium]|nr:ATP phosphoribosyltransferase regulatory subunit [Clostridia bacterium]